MAAGAGPLEHPAQQDYEQRLIQRIRDGEHEAFYVLIRPYERRVYAAAFALLRNAADAEDCVKRRYDGSGSAVEAASSSQHIESRRLSIQLGILSEADDRADYRFAVH